jgi:hypothetical protein
MAVRIQVRRGTTSEWNSADPTLFEGEIGYNTTLYKFKIGDGETAWSELEYAPTSEDLSTSLGDYIELAEKGAADGVAELDASANVLTQTSVVFEGATADAFETTLVVVDPTDDRTITLPNATGTLALTTDITVTPSSTNTLTNKTLTSPIISGLTISDGSIVVEGATANDHETTLQFTDPTADRTITFPDATGTIALAANVAALSGATFTGAIEGTSLTLSGDLTINGTTTNINTTNLVVEDKNIVIGDTATPTDTTADGGGITLKGATDKTLNWVDATDSWTSSEHIDLATGKVIKVAGTQVLSATQYTGNAATVTNGVYTTDAGTVTSTMIADGTIVDGDINAAAAIAQSKI